MSIEDHLPKWERWLDEIQAQVYAVLSDRYIFDETMKLVSANPETHNPNDFVAWFIQQYIYGATSRIRQQTDKDQRSISLWNLLTDLERRATLITREWFVAQCAEPSDEDAANSFFDTWCGPCRRHADPAVFERQRQELETACQAIRKYVNKRVAHHAAVADDKLKIPTWGELNGAIDTVHSLTCRCIQFLRQEPVHDLLPTWNYNWKVVFERPWKAR